MRELYPRPNWLEAGYVAWDSEQWNSFATGDERVPEPTTLGMWIDLQICWMVFHVKHWRCWLRGHDYGKWQLNRDHTAAYSTCSRCDDQIGRGEY